MCWAEKCSDLTYDPLPISHLPPHRGSLQDVIDRGQFYLDRSDIDKGPKMDAVLATASEMAQVRSVGWSQDDDFPSLVPPPFEGGLHHDLMAD